MLLISGANQKIQVVTAAAGDIERQVSFVENNAGALAPDNLNDANITTATTTDVLPAAGASKQRAVKLLSLRNTHASQTVVVTVQVTDGSVVSQLAKATLLAGEALVMDDVGGWAHYDVNMGIYPALGNLATQAEMEAGTATDKVVTPQGVNWHPGVCKCWGKANGAGTTLNANWNVSSIADTGTGRLGVNIGTDFSSANYSIQATLERSVTALTATGVEDQNIRNASQAAGSFEIESYDHTATTMAAQDPSSYYWACFGDQ